MEKLVSVIIPIYNVEKYIGKCIESVIKQIYRNLEIILVDDGSPDNCGEICDKYAKEDERIIVIHKENGGLSDARNEGLKIAKGEYIYFLDSDDYIDIKTIKKCIDTIERDNTKICIFNYVQVDISGNKLNDKHIIKNGIWTENEFWENYYFKNTVFCVIACNKVVHRSIYDDLRFDVGKLHEDEFIIHKLISKVNKISIIEDSMYFYLKREGSITYKRSIKSLLDILESNYKRYEYFAKNYHSFQKRAFKAYFSNYMKMKKSIKKYGDKIQRKILEGHKKNIEMFSKNEYRCILSFFLRVFLNLPCWMFKGFVCVCKKIKN